MEVRYINEVCAATENIFRDYFGVEAKSTKPYAGTFAVDANNISVILGVHGDLKGQIICSFDDQTAKNIVGRMMGGMEIEQLDEMGWSALQEFGNWIAGSSCTEISKEEVFVDVAPPVINEGSSKFHSNNVFISIPLESELGVMKVHISLKRG